MNRNARCREALASTEQSTTIPINLPEDAPTVYSHTRLLLDGYDLLTEP